MKMLIVDDQALFRQGVAIIVRELYPDAVVIEAATAAAAVDAAGRHRDIRLVLCDLQLESGSDFEVLERLVQVLPKAAIAVISGSDDTADIARAYKAGAKGYIEKSSSSDTLRHALPLILSGETYVPAAAMTALRDPGVAAQVGNPAAAAGLTPRQSEILQFMAKGFSNKEIGAELGMTEGTVKVHVKTILAKLEAANRTQAVIKAIRLGIVPRSVLDEIDD